MSATPQVWDAGTEPGPQLVLFGVAATLSFVVVDLLLVGRLSLFFDLCFIVLCLVLALRIRAADMFTAGVLPPLIMLGVFVLLAITFPTSLTGSPGSIAQTVISGLAGHSVALAVGYLLCLGCLAIRRGKPG